MRSGRGSLRWLYAKEVFGIGFEFVEAVFGAEVVGSSLVFECSDGVLGIDIHPADRIVDGLGAAAMMCVMVLGFAHGIEVGRNLAATASHLDGAADQEMACRG